MARVLGLAVTCRKSSIIVPIVDVVNGRTNDLDIWMAFPCSVCDLHHAVVLVNNGRNVVAKNVSSRYPESFWDINAGRLEDGDSV